MRSDFVFPTHPAHDLQVLALAAAVITPQFGHFACSWCSFPALGDLNPTRCWSALELPGVLTALTLWSYNFFFFFNFRRFLKGFYVVLFWRHKHEDAVSCNYSLLQGIPASAFLQFQLVNYESLFSGRDGMEETGRFISSWHVQTCSFVNFTLTASKIRNSLQVFLTTTKINK